MGWIMLETFQLLQKAWFRAPKLSHLVNSASCLNTLWQDVRRPRARCK